jgi:hypothetical protein
VHFERPQGGLTEFVHEKTSNRLRELAPDSFRLRRESWGAADRPTGVRLNLTELAVRCGYDPAEALFSGNIDMVFCCSLLFAAVRLRLRSLSAAKPLKTHMEYSDPTLTALLAELEHLPSRAAVRDHLGTLRSRPPQGTSFVARAFISNIALPYASGHQAGTVTFLFQDQRARFEKMWCRMH